MLQQIQQFLKNNFILIIFITLILVGSNILTSISVNSLSRKEKQEIKHKLDSLEDRYKQLDFVHQIEINKRRKIFLRDSLLQIQLLERQSQDAILIKQYSQALTKFKALSSKRNLYLLDSAYNAEN